MSSSVEAELAAVAAEWDRAMVENDAERIGHYMADDWTIIGADGKGRRQGHFPGARDVMETHDPKVRVYGDTAVLTARGVSGGTYDGQPFRELERSSCVFVRQAGRWRCVLTHLSRILSCTLVALVLSGSTPAEPAPDTAELIALLNEFLAGASRDDVATHERFWAEELIYTGSGGKRIGKVDILRDVREATAKPGEPKTTYIAEDVRIQPYGDTAVVAFRLVGTTEHGASAEVTRYLNTGTFVRRDGRWQAVAWQATRAALDVAQVTAQLLGLEKIWNEAHVRGDADALDGLWADDLVVTVPGMPRMTKPEVLAVARSGRMRFLRYDTSDLRVQVHGEAAIVNGRLVRSRERDGQIVEDDWQFSKVYVRTTSGWQVVGYHAS